MVVTPSQPLWLRRPEWAARRLVYRAGWFTESSSGAGRIEKLLVGILALLGLPCFAAVAYTIVGAFGAIPTGVGIVVAVGLGYLLLRAFGGGSAHGIHRYEYVCHLETLPGVIGGWFKAWVEASLPDRPNRFLIELAHSVPGHRGSRRTWSDGYRVPPTAVETSAGRYRIPARFQIPRDVPHKPIEPPSLGMWAGPRWTLRVVAEMPRGQVCRGIFEVPIFKTDQAPIQEQEAEELTIPVEPVASRRTPSAQSDEYLRHSRIVSAGMLGGIVLFLGVALVMRPVLKGNASGNVVLSYLAAGGAVVSLPVARGVRAARWPRTQPGQDPNYWRERQKAHIGSIGILHGAALFCCIALVVSKPWWPLLAMAVPLATMLAWFPRDDRSA